MASPHGPSSSRLFSLQVAVPPKVFLSLVYKLEGPSNVRVALELTTGDAGSCHVGGISALDGEGQVSPFAGCLGGGECRSTGSRGAGAGGAGPSASADRAAVASRGQGDPPVSRTPGPGPVGSAACCAGLHVCLQRLGERAWPAAGHGIEAGRPRAQGEARTARHGQPRASIPVAASCLPRCPCYEGLGPPAVFPAPGLP